MGDQAPHIPDVNDSEKFESQRRALSGLLARFTADRDALIASVHECEQHVAAIAARLDAHGNNGTPGGNGASSGETSQVEELRQLIKEFRLEQRETEGQLRKIAEHAMLRADEALRSIDEVAAAPRSGDNTAAFLARFTADRDALMASVHECEQRLTTLATRLDAHDHDTSSDACEGADVSRLDERQELRERIEQMREAQEEAESRLRKTAEHAMMRADEALRAIEELVGAAGQPQGREDVAALLASFTADRDALRVAVHETQKQLATLTERVATLDAQGSQVEGAPAEASLQPDALRAELVQLQAAQRHAEAQLSQATEAATSRAEEALKRLDELVVAQRARDDHTQELLARLSMNHDALMAVIDESEQRLATLVERVRADYQLSEAETRSGGAHALSRAEEALQGIAELASTQQVRDDNVREAMGRFAANHDVVISLIDESERRLTALVERVHADHQQSEAESRATSEHALSRAEEALQRIAELARAQEAREDSARELMARLAANHDALMAVVDDSEQRLTTLIEQVRETGTTTTDGGGVGEQALLHAEDALRRIEELVTTQRERDARNQEFLSRFANERDVLASAVTESERRLTTALDELRAEQDRAESRWDAADAQALTRANDALQQINELVAAQQARDSETQEVLTRLATEHEVLVSAVRESEQRLMAAIEPAHIQTRFADAQGDQTPTDGLTDDLRRMEVGIERIEPPTAGVVPTEAVADLLDRVGHIEAEVGVLRQNLDEAHEAQKRLTASHSVSADNLMPLSSLDAFLLKWSPLTWAQNRRYRKKRVRGQHNEVLHAETQHNAPQRRRILFQHLQGVSLRGDRLIRKVSRLSQVSWRTAYHRTVPRLWPAVTVASVGAVTLGAVMIGYWYFAPLRHEVVLQNARNASQLATVQPVPKAARGWKPSVASRSKETTFGHAILPSAFAGAFQTTLSVETSFPETDQTARGPLHFSTKLSVETSFPIGATMEAPTAFLMPIQRLR